MAILGLPDSRFFVTQGKSLYSLAFGCFHGKEGGQGGLSHTSTRLLSCRLLVQVHLSGLVTHLNLAATESIPLPPEPSSVSPHVPSPTWLRIKS
jgi:hypothetical protein